MASKKDIGSFAGIAAIVAVIVHTLFPVGPEGGGGSRGTESVKTGEDQAKSANSAEPVALEGPWLATRAFFSVPPAKSEPIVYETIKPLLTAKSLNAQARNEWRDRLGLGGRDDLHSWAIVATVADPVHSHMQQFFDGQIQSIEKAVALHGWEFVTQWLPWRAQADGNAGDFEKQGRERELEREQEALPGILVFRRDVFPSDVLFVLLVPETPTKGISGGAFYAALQLARVLSSHLCGLDGPCKTGLLAPSFSGSFESLTRFLQAWDDTQGISDTVYGGSISSADNAECFEAAFSNKPKHFKFRSGIADSESYIDAFEKVLSYYHIGRDKAAFWVEEESGFGASFRKETRPKTRNKETCRETQTRPVEENEIPTYMFPREISHLRSAYQEAMQSSPKAQSGAPTLDISLKDPSHGEDSIPVFSDTHTPVGQSAAISTITEEFRREGTQMVFIVAGNTLDSLLLARFVRTESPNTRVVIGDADMLFIPAASQESLNGTLFLSTYPMFILGQEWLTRAANGEHGEKEKHLLFQSASHEGLFNVTQLVLAGIKADQPPGDGDCLYGYRQLLSGEDKKDERPGLWLLTVTNFGFLPLNWFRAHNPEQWFGLRSSLGCSADEAGSKALEERFPLDPPTLGWYLAVLVTSLAIILVCIWRVLSHTSLASEWFPAQLGAALSFTAVQWILVLPAWRVLAGLDTSPERGNVATLSVALIALVAPLVSFGIIFIRSGRGTLSQKFQLLTEKCARPRRARTYAAVMIGLFLWISFEWAWANGGVGSATRADALLFRMRATQLFSGASPTLPLFLLSLVFCFGFLVYILRYADATREGNNGRPDPGLADTSLAKIDEWLTAPFGLPDAAFRQRLIVCVALVTVAVSIVGTGMFAFESPAFNCALYIAVGVVLYSLATACYDLIGIWRHMRTFLNRLEWGHKEVFERVTKEWPRRRLIWLWHPVPEGFFEAQLTSAAQDRQDVLALQICRYLVYAVRQMQRIAWSIGLALVMLIVVLSAYSVQSPQLVGRFVAVLFVVIGGVVIWVFASMEKNWIISRIDRTEPGDLNFEFWIQATAVVAVPLVGVLVHLFPSIGGFVSSWLAPSLEALK